ncbi:MAG TPA: ribose 5-phosphate isomerase B [Dissulfurispiraceae bacterium]|nr:ribose 5-phosphate isomerase B [Dissulfurispiraceae bacterium]
MKVAVGSDHGGYVLKGSMIAFLLSRGYNVVDAGARQLDSSDDYPDFAKAVSELVLSAEVDRGILICGSGVGASIAANKFPGIRAALCHDSFSAHQGVEDDNMNVLCLGARVIGEELAKELALIFLKAEFSHAERHLRRLEKVDAIEGEFMIDDRRKT